MREGGKKTGGGGGSGGLRIRLLAVPQLAAGLDPLPPGGGVPSALKWGPAHELMLFYFLIAQEWILHGAKSRWLYAVDNRDDCFTPRPSEYIFTYLKICGGCTNPQTYVPASTSISNRIYLAISNLVQYDSINLHGNRAGAGAWLRRSKKEANPFLLWDTLSLIITRVRLKTLTDDETPLLRQH